MGLAINLFKGISILFLLSSLESICFADNLPAEPEPADPSPEEQTTPVKSETSNSVVRFSLIGGFSLLGNTKYSAKIGGQTFESKDKASPSPNVGGEVIFRLNRFFGLGPVIEWTKYKYNAGTTPDTELSFYVLPRFQFGKKKTQFWFGLGLGATQMQVQVL